MIELKGDFYKMKIIEIIVIKILRTSNDNMISMM